MIKVLLCLFMCMIFVVPAQAELVDCPLSTSWKVTSEYRDLYKIYQEKVDPSKFYLVLMSSNICSYKYWHEEPWTQEEIQESVDFWNNAEQHFCVIRDETGYFESDDYRYLINGELSNSNIDDEEINEVKKDLIIHALFNVVEQEDKLFALESMGLIERGKKYPTCNQ